MRMLILCAFLGCASAQYVKTAGVKGGHSQGGYGYRGGENLIRTFNSTTYGSNQTQYQYGYAAHHNTTTNTVNYETGVCYVEVPTSSLVLGHTHIPAGNGSRPELSRIRTCCKGYVKNIHNYKICDPVCTEECVNALCTAPDTCTCYPDHVKNKEGVCISTCPIGCQNGQCAGGECLCKDGYALDSESKYCSPICMENCGGTGNCTAPNSCKCKEGFRSTPEGSCKIDCGVCTNGECVSPNVCRCLKGYERKLNLCVPTCSPGCVPDGECVSPNVCKFPPNSSGGQITQAINHNSNQTGSNYPYPHGQPITHNYPYYNEGDRRNNPSNYPYPNQDTNRPNYPGHNYPTDLNVYPLNPQQPSPNTNPGHNPNNPNQGTNNPNSTVAGYPYPLYHDNGPIYNYYPNQPMYPSPGNQVSNQGNYPNNPTVQGAVQGLNQGTNNPNSTVVFYPNPSNQDNGPMYSNNYPNQSPYPSSGSQVSNQGANNLYPNLNQGSSDGHVCSQPCLNGVCVEGNRCSCYSGYALDSTDPSGFACRPVCHGGCPNGICSAPNFCICNLGFYKDTSVKGRPACVKRIR